MKPINVGIKIDWASWIMGLIILTIVAIPFVTHNEIYQTLRVAPDGLVHIKVINDYDNRLIPNILYPAQAIFGFAMALIVAYSHIPSNAVFMGFMAVILATSLWTIYYVISKLSSVQAGYVAVLLGLFRINSILSLFTYAVAFNLLDMYIVLPFAIFFIVKWLLNKQKRDLIFGLLFMAIFSGLHVVAIYIPYVVITMLACLGIYKLITHKSVRLYVITGLLVIAVNLAVSLPLLGHQIFPLTQNMVGNIIQTLANGQQLALMVYYFFMIDVTPLVLGICLIGLVTLIAYRKKLAFTQAERYLVFIFGVMALVLTASGILGSSFAPDRSLKDGVIIFGLLISIILAVIWRKRNEMSWLITPTLVLVGLNIINTGIGWIR